MTDANGAAKPDTLPTATAADRVDEYLSVESGMATLVLVNPDKQKFAITCAMPMVATLSRMCGRLMQIWHVAKPEIGVFVRAAVKGTVSTSEEMPNKVGLSFDDDIVHVMDSATAHQFARNIITAVERTMTDAERLQMVTKKSRIIVPPRRSMIR